MWCVSPTPFWMRCAGVCTSEMLGHRGYKGDPLYRARKLLAMAHERIGGRGDSKLRGLLAAGDPHGEVREHTARERNPARDLRHQLRRGRHCYREATGRRLPRTRACPRRSTGWAARFGVGEPAFSNWYRARVSNGPTEAANNLMKRIKRVGFAFHELRELSHQSTTVRR